MGFWPVPTLRGTGVLGRTEGGMGNDGGRGRGHGKGGVEGGGGPSCLGLELGVAEGRVGPDCVPTRL